MKIFLCAIVLALSASVVAQTPGNQRVNPLLTPSTLPFQAPVFDRITDADFQPAFEEGMKQQLAEIASIANNPAAPTFANTIEAMERSGALLRRVNPIFDSVNESNTNPALQKIDRDMAPRLAAHQDEISLNGKLFTRVKAIYDTRAALKLDPEATHLVELYYRDFVRAGPRLDDAAKARLRALNKEESSLETDYRVMRLAGANAGAIVVDDRKLLDGLSDADITAAADAAKVRGLTGKWLLALQNTAQQPVEAVGHEGRRHQHRELHQARGRPAGALDV